METFDIDPAGDVLVEIGEQHVRVSSKVLSLASPVFKAMFNSGFKESITPHTSSENPLKISLPSDNIDSFLIFVRITHLQTQQITAEDISIEALEGLVTFCDKYQCTTAVTSYFEVQLAIMAINTPSNKLFRLLIAAFYLDIPWAFSRIFSTMLGSQEQPLESLPEVTYEIASANVIIDKFNACRNEQARGMEEVLMKPIWELISTTCLEAHAMTGNYLCKLKQQGYLPIETAIQAKSVCDMSEKFVLSTLMIDKKSYNCPLSSCPCHKWSNISALVEVKHNLLALLEKMEAAPGLCLDCLKTGGKSKHEKTCRLGHA